MAEILHPFANPTLPSIFRVVNIMREATSSGFRLTAELHHAGANPTVTWRCRQPDTRLKAGTLVKPMRAKLQFEADGTLAINHLMLLERPEASLNLFETVPPTWVSDEDLLVRASTLWGVLPDPLRALFNTVFWQGERFRRFCEGPSSMNGHHDGRNGNLRHSIEVAETVMRMLPLYKAAHTGVAVLAALLHDAGKAAEYEFCGSSLRMSDQGSLLGHKLNVATWVAVARAQMTLGVPEGHYLSLLHALTAVPGAPAWMGQREPATPEATLLSLADRASGHADLMNRHMAPDGGWGQQHPHMKARPFTTPQSGIVRRQFAGLEAMRQRIKDRQTKQPGN